MVMWLAYRVGLDYVHYLLYSARVAGEFHLDQTRFFSAAPLFLLGLCLFLIRPDTEAIPPKSTGILLVLALLLTKVVNHYLIWMPNTKMANSFLALLYPVDY